MALGFKIISLCLSLVLLKLLVSVNGQETVIGDKYYRVITLEKVNWYQAFQLCEAGGMKLASIESDSDLTALKEFLFTNSLLFDNYWLSGNNLASRGEYVWLYSGNKFSYSNWANNQPGTLANRCTRTDADLKWATDACKNAHYYICSKPVLPDCGITGRCNPNYNLSY